MFNTKKKYMKKKINQGVALISVLGISAISLIIISVVVIVSIINAKMSFSRLQTDKAYQSADGLVDEAVLRFVRIHACPDLYPEWTEPCLQIPEVQCKMSCSLDGNQGTIDSWAKTGKTMRHLKVEVYINEDESVSVSAQKEIY